MACRSFLRYSVPFKISKITPRVRFRQFSGDHHQRWTVKRTIIYCAGVATLAVTGTLVSKVNSTEIKLEATSSGVTQSKDQLYPNPDEIAGIWKRGLPVYSYDVILKHDSQETGIWVTYKDGVYDITNFVSRHFGGDVLLVAAGKAIDPYWTIYNVHNNIETYKVLESLRIGNFDRKTAPNSDDVVVEDQWKNEPKSRYLAQYCSQSIPFNSETPQSMLINQFYTPNDIFYVRNHLPVPAKVDPKKYRLEIAKEGSKPIQVTLNDIIKLPHHTISVTLQCGGNRRSSMSAVKQVCGFGSSICDISNATWTGVLLRDILKETGVDEYNLKGIKHVQFEGFDQDAMGLCYGASIPIETAMNPQSEILLAFKMNGEELPMDHGYPLRVIVPGTIGARSVKWLSRIILSSEESPSSWQRRDYKLFPANIDVNNVDFNSSQAIQEMPVQSAICSPMPGSSVKVSDGVVNIRGYAYSGGGRAISRVDVSINGGKEWHTANLKSDPEQKYKQAWAWTLWEVTIAIPENYVGDLDLCCKALDSSCNTQPEKVETIWNFRGLANNSWHHVPIKIVKE